MWKVLESGEGSCIKTPHISATRYSVRNVGDFLMPKKHFIATHTFISEETKKEYFENCKGMSSEDFFSYAKNEYAECTQHWMGVSDFFFCHWLADDEDAILNLLMDSGDDKIFHTLCAEMSCYIYPEDGNEDVYAEIR